MLINSSLRKFGIKGIFSILLLSILSIIQVVALREIGINLATEIGINNKSGNSSIYISIIFLLIASTISSFLTYRIMHTITSILLFKIQNEFSFGLNKDAGEDIQENFTNKFGSEVARLQITFTNNVATGFTQLIIVLSIYLYLLWEYFIFTILLSGFISIAILFIIFF